MFPLGIVVREEVRVIGNKRDEVLKHPLPAMFSEVAPSSIFFACDRSQWPLSGHLRYLKREDFPVGGSGGLVNTERVSSPDVHDVQPNHTDPLRP